MLGPALFHTPPPFTALSLNLYTACLPLRSTCPRSFVAEPLHTPPSGRPAQEVLSLNLYIPLPQVDLPKKHGRGGQSALRFARLRLEKRHNYVRKVRGGVHGHDARLQMPRGAGTLSLHPHPVQRASITLHHSSLSLLSLPPSLPPCSHSFGFSLPSPHSRSHPPSALAPCVQVAEMAVQFFITNDRPNVSGIVLAGSADFKTDLGQSDMFDPRLQAVVLGSVDVSYGG